MKKGCLSFLILCLAFGDISAQSADDFWKVYAAAGVEAKVIDVAPAAKKSAVAFPGKTGLSVQWNNQDQIWFGNTDVLPNNTTIAPINNFFIPEENKLPWVEFFEADFLVTDSVSAIKFSTAWNTGAQITGHIRKGWGITTQFGYATLKETQQNFLKLIPFVPSTQTAFATLTTTRVMQQWNFYTGLNYQFLHKRVQPAVSLGYQLCHLRSSEMQFTHGPFKETVPLKVKTVMHGWRLQFLTKIFLVKGFYVAPQLEFGQLYNLSNAHSIVLVGGGIGYQFDSFKK